MVYKNTFWKLLLLLLLAISGIAPAVGQISSSEVDHIDTLTYRTNTDTIRLFVFYQPESAGKSGSLTAQHPTGGPFDFAWSAYDHTLPGFGPVFSQDNGVSSSTVNNLADGAYRVRIFNGVDIDTTITTWVFLNRFSNEIEKDANGEVPSYRYTCNRISLAGFVYPDTLVYYNLQNNDTIVEPLSYTFLWTSDNPDLTIPQFLTSTSYLPPYKDTEYYLGARDKYGNSDSDTIFYRSIQTKAEFEVAYLDKITGEYDPDLTISWSADVGSLDAPLTVRFLNISQNGNNFEWVLLDTTGGYKEVEYTYDTADFVEFVYETADKDYYPYLVSTSEAACIDTFSISGGITVVKSQLEIPNVFSPNNDGTNDFWVFKHQSLKHCMITVVDRTGKIVYKKEIDDIYSWEGWGGYLHNSSRQAPEGQYYYVIEGLGYDDVVYMDETYWSRRFSGKDNTTDGTGTSGTGTSTTDEPTFRETMYTGWLYLFRQSVYN